jgi:hypothetical protein
MPNVWPALDEDGVSLTVPDINGTPVPVNGLAVNSNEYNSYYSNLVFGGRLLTRDPLNSGDSPSTVYNAGAVQAIDAYTELDALRGLYDDAQAQTADGYFWRWDSASTAGVAVPDVDGDGVRAPDVGQAGRWLQHLPVGSGTSTLAGDTTGPSAGNTVQGIYTRPIASSAAAATAGQSLRLSPAGGTIATCAASFTCTGVRTIASGQQCRNAAGTFFEITTGGTESGGSIAVTITGEGSTGNIAAGSTLTLCTPIRENPVTFSSSSGLLATFTNDFVNLCEVTFSTNNALPTGLAAGTSYWLIRVSATTARIATSLVNAQSGTAIAYTDSGAGSHRIAVVTMTSTGTVGGPGISGLIDRYVSYDITGPRIHQADKLFNGDARKGVYPNLSTDSTAGLQAAINALTPGDQLDLGNNFYRVQAGPNNNELAALYIDKGEYSSNSRAIEIFGRNQVENNTGGSKLIFVGSSPSSSLFWMATDRCVLRGFTLTTANSQAPYCYIAVGRRSKNASVNFNNYINLWFENSFATVPYMVSIGGIVGHSGGCENQVFISCRFQSILTAGVEVASGPQPYSISFARCKFFGNSNEVPRGFAIYNRNVSSSYSFTDCDMQQLEGGAWLTQPTVLDMSKVQFEHCKKAFYDVSGSSGSSAISIKSSRFNPLSINVASSGPVGFTAADQDVIVADSGTLNVESFDAGGSGVGFPDARIRLGTHTSATIDVIWPSVNVFKRKPGTLNAVSSVHLRGFADTGGGTFLPFSDYPQGTENGTGTFSIHGTDTTQVVALPRPEWSGEGYDIQLTCVGSSASPASLSQLVDVTTKGTQSFTARLGAPPGAGEYRTIAWSMRKSRRLIDTPLDLGTPFLWLRSDGIAQSAGAVTGWTCTSTGKTFSIDALAPVYSASDANLNGLATITLTQGTAEAMNSDDASSIWEFMSDATTSWFMMAVVYHPLAGALDSLGYTIGTKNSTAATRGAAFRNDYSGNSRLGLGIADGTLQGAIGTGYAYTAGKRWWFGQLSANATGPGYGKTSCDASMWTEIPDYGGISLSAGTPQTTFRMQNQSTTQDLTIAEVLLMKRWVSPVEADALLQGYFVPRYAGLVSP